MTSDKENKRARKNRKYPLRESLVTKEGLINENKTQREAKSLGGGGEGGEEPDSTVTY